MTGSRPRSERSDRWRRALCLCLCQPCPKVRARLPVAEALGSTGLDRSLHFAQLMKNQFRRGPGFGILGVGHVLFGVADILGKGIAIDLGQRNGLLGQDGQAGRADIGETAANEDPLDRRRFGPG